MQPRALPPHLLPDEVTDAQRRLRAYRRQGWIFWLMWLPMAIGVGVVAGVAAGVWAQMALTVLALPVLAIGRFVWWYRQRPQRIQAHKDINRWRMLPDDERWHASVVLLDRIVQLSEHDAGLVDTAQRMMAMLFRLYEEIQGLDRTIAADRALENELDLSERFHRLVAIRIRRNHEVDALINGLRDLHLELSEQPHVGPLQERMTEMMDRLEADREGARASSHRQAVLDRARQL